MANQESKRRESLSDVLFSFSGPIFSNKEQVTKIPIDELHPFRNHPFKVLDDEKMQETVESILQNDVLVPGIARPRFSGGYEIISGHRRKRAAELAGKTEVPFIIRDYSDEQATIIMVDSNIQRENLLPSEKAFAYRMKHEALKHQGKNTGKSTYEEVGSVAGDNAKTVQRYIRLTELIPELLQLVDDKKLGFIAGVDLSFLTIAEQTEIYQIMCRSGKIIDGKLAEQLKKDSIQGKIDTSILGVSENIKKKATNFKMKAKWRKEFFEDNVTDEDIEKIIYNLLRQWKENRGGF